jgi:hypothetical protein
MSWRGRQRSPWQTVIKTHSPMLRPDMGCRTCSRWQMHTKTGERCSVAPCRSGAHWECRA